MINAIPMAGPDTMQIIVREITSDQSSNVFGLDVTRRIIQLANPIASHAGCQYPFI